MLLKYMKLHVYILAGVWPAASWLVRAARGPRAVNYSPVV